MKNLESLVNIFNTLCQVQVSGYQNVSLLAGCMQTLKNVIEEMSSQEESQAYPADSN
ncbi:MAG: hypothetical protein HFE73_05155 [Firmicutes bacterium]|jgi:hypothetical protein|nr:hypothetical protein [Bacillota bacterium]